MKYTFKSGAVVEGTFEQLQSVSTALGEALDFTKVEGLKEGVPSGYYLTSKGKIEKLSDMNVMHLRNALLKRTQILVEDMKKQKALDDKSFLETFVGLTEDPVITSVFGELASR